MSRTLSSIVLILLGLVLAGCGGKNTSARDKFLKAHAAFTEKVAAINKADTEATEECWQECRRLTNEIDPKFPPGIDPELSLAINQFREEKLAYYNAFLNGSSRAKSKADDALAKYKMVWITLATKYDVDLKTF